MKRHQILTIRADSSHGNIGDAGVTFSKVIFGRYSEEVLMARNDMMSIVWQRVRRNTGNLKLKGI